MQHIKTFYQLYDTEEVICTIDGILVSLPNGSEVCFGDKIYTVRSINDVIKDFNTVHRSIWLKDE